MNKGALNAVDDLEMVIILLFLNVIVLAFIGKKTFEVELMDVRYGLRAAIAAN